MISPNKIIWSLNFIADVNLPIIRIDKLKLKVTRIYICIKSLKHEKSIYEQNISFKQTFEINMPVAVACRNIFVRISENDVLFVTVSAIYAQVWH